jgi:TPR repeat protein
VSAEQSAFVSYSREDSEFALRLTQDLKASGAHVWLDQLDIPPGYPWDNAIEDALNTAPQMLLILSPNSAKSENVRNEISYAIEQGKIIIPVLYQDCTVPLRLQRTQRIDFRADYARGLNALMVHLGVANLDPAIFEKVKEEDAKRRAAWQAREAEALRLRETPERQQEAAERKAREEELQQLQAAREQGDRDRLERERLERERIEREQADRERLRLEAEGAALREKRRLEELEAAERRKKIIRWSIIGGSVAVFLILLAIYLSRPTPPAPVLPPAAPIVTQPATQPVPQPVAPPANAVLWNSQGDNYFNQKDYKNAMPLYQQACDAGESYACTSLGYLYTQGDGVTKNLETGVAYYRAGCTAGDMTGCADLGNHIRDGDAGSPANPQMASGFFLEACNGGNDLACRSLAILSDNGSSLGVDYAKAKLYYQKACTLKDQVSCDTLKQTRFN